MTADLFLLSAHGAAATVDYAVAAEAAGFAGVWLAEHHFIEYGRCPSATALAGVILGRTSRLVVGTAACVLSNRHPVALGEEAVLLDEASGGRFRLGVGRGGPWADLEVFGTGLSRYEHGFAESLDVLLDWVSGRATVSATGRHFTFREVAVVPRPPRPLPVWVAATSPSTVDIAAARGLPLLLGVHDDPAALLDRYGPSDVEHAVARLVALGESQAAAEGRLRRTLRPWLATTRGYLRLDGAPPRDTDAYAEHLIRTSPIGTPAAVAEGLLATGAARVLLMVEAAGDRAATLDLIATLGAEVLPLLSGRGARLPARLVRPAAET
ncbi:LLM class flavin-dependent oxidoreductase [Phytohabitans houttuyneae]|uniref:Alkanal monooxygenase n=1 Tax=Phytohabitans houttuyneae TaxID=1076126 RepID=A0A6V8KKL8_9ACTN|nr:LLM class flavin-dependent oxidoreductase [Phytohabitans houttuyneae]GFJ85653.1 alkanal monooxygenase [Phytohabitans houttuyneae]